MGSQVSGTIAKLNADFNTRVKKDQVVAELDQAKFRARVDETRANVRAAEANLAKSKVLITHLDKSVNLLTGSISNSSSSSVSERILSTGKQVFFLVFRNALCCRK